MAFLFGDYRPTRDEGRPLIDGGDALVTVTSHESDRHVTLRARCMAGRAVVPWDDAERVEFTDFDGERIATYMPHTGVLDVATDAPGRAVWTVGATLRWLAGQFPLLAERADVDVVHADGRSTVAA